MKYKVLVISNLKQYKSIMEMLDKNESDNQFVMVGQAENSVVGMSMIEKLEPNIVIMPQYMTFWNAIDLIGKIKEKGLKVQFVLVCSNMGDFYSQLSADKSVSVAIGQQDFNASTLLDALYKAAKDWEELSLAAVEAPANISILNWIAQQTELIKLITGKNAFPNPSINLEGLPAAGTEPSWLFLASIARIKENLDSRNTSFSSWDVLVSHLSPLLNKYGGGTLCMLREGLMCIILSSSVINNCNQFSAFLDEINHQLQVIDFPPLVLDVPDHPASLMEWPKVYSELMKLHKYRFFMGNTPVLRSSILNKVDTDLMFDEVNSHLEDLMRSMHTSSDDKLVSVIDALFKVIRRSLSFDLFNFTWSQLLLRYSMLVQTYDLTKQKFIRFQVTQRFNNLEQYKSEALILFRDLCGEIRSLSVNQNPLITEAIMIMKKDYAMGITLKSTAKKLHVNSSYLSRLFTKETGCTFVNYLNQIRINRAKKLLSTHTKIGDIAEQVGFTNAKYFSQIFKRFTGKTPKEFRHIAKEEGDVS